MKEIAILTYDSTESLYDDWGDTIKRSRILIDSITDWTQVSDDDYEVLKRFKDYNTLIIERVTDEDRQDGKVTVRSILNQAKKKKQEYEIQRLKDIEKQEKRKSALEKKKKEKEKQKQEDEFKVFQELQKKFGNVE